MVERTLSDGADRLEFGPGDRTTGPVPLLSPLLATVLGILLARGLPGGIEGGARGGGLWGVLAGAALVAWGLRFRCSTRTQVGSAGVTQGLLLLAILCGATAVSRTTWTLVPSDHIALVDLDEPVSVVVRGRVVSEPLRIPAPPPDPLCTFERTAQTRFDLQLTSMRDGRRWSRRVGTLEVTAPDTVPHLRIGSVVQVCGRLSRFRRPRNPGEFDRAEYERARRRWCRLRALHREAIQVRYLERPGWFAQVPARLAAAVRRHARRQLRTYVGGEGQRLAVALLLGERRQLDPELTERFFLTGTIHLLAISGLHVGILAFGFWLLALAVGLNRRRALVAVLVAVVLYAWLVTARTPVVRAATLITLAGWCRLAGRVGSRWNALAAAALMTLWSRPHSLFEPGAQLSFLAVATLSAWHTFRCRRALERQRQLDPLTRLIQQTRPVPVRLVRRGLHAGWELFLAALVVWTVSLPLVLYHFHLVAPAATFLNPLLWLPVTASLFGGMGVVLCGGWCPPIAWLAGIACSAGLTTLLSTIELTQRMTPWVGWAPGPRPWWLMAWYLGLAAAARWHLARHGIAARPAVRIWARRGLVAWLMVGTLTGAVWWPLPPSVLQRGLAPTDRPTRTPAVECVFLAVDHGTCVVLHLPDGRTWLYDAGHLGCPESVARTVAGYLWRRRIVSLDALVLSHADADHFNAIPEILKRFRAPRLLVSPHLARRLNSDEPLGEGIEPLREALRAAGTRVVAVQAGASFVGGEPELDAAVRLTFEFPTRRAVIEEENRSDNARSLVLRVSAWGRSVVLPGDLEDAGLRDWLETGPGTCEVLMAPHHGRSDPSLARLADSLEPSVVVVSSGDPDAPPWETLAQRHGFHLAVTRRKGAIRVRWSPLGHQVTHWDQDRGWVPLAR